MKMILTKPLLIDDVELKEIEYDFDNLGVDAVDQAVKTLRKGGHIIGMQETDMDLHALLFAKSSGLDITELKRMSAKDYLRAGRLVRDFFFLDSEDGSEMTS